jgi:hypothetical protein
VNRSVIALIVICLMVAFAVSAYAMASEYSKKNPFVGDPAWPDGLESLLNSKARVYGYWCNSVDTLYCSGNTEAFSRFLLAYSKVELPGHTLTIHSERGTAKTLIGGKKIGFDWTVTVERSSSPPGVTSQAPAVTVDLWAGEVRRDKITVPKNVDVFGAGASADSVKTPPAFAIYLLADSTLNARDALKLNLGKLSLQEKPLFTIGDIVSYRWKDHTLTFKPEAVGRVPKMANVYGVPFVVTVDGRRLYAGAFWTCLSSAGFPSAPIIYVDPPLRGKNALRIDLPATGKGDPRGSPAIKAAFEKAGKLL